jgi:hypothetical protein
VRVPYGIYAAGCVALAGRVLARVVRSP